MLWRGSNRAGSPELRIAVVSPFVDKQHGTERALIELLQRLAKDYGVEIHLYAQRVADLTLSDPSEIPTNGSPGGRIVWHKVPSISGPHLFQYLWWFFTNRFIRWLDVRFGRLSLDLVYSPCINSPDANAITVHIVFCAFYEEVRPQLRFSNISPLRWPLLIHRLLYYRLIMALERRIYAKPRVALSAISALVSSQLRRFFGREDSVVARYGLDVRQFNAHGRLALRETARSSFGASPSEFVFLLIGNDWKKKGLDALLEALTECTDLPVRLFIVGKDQREPYIWQCEKLQLGARVGFLNPSADVLQFYAAADAYVGPSLEDAYGLPILEAMACGLPVIASVAAGASEIISHRENGLLLQNPRDVKALSQLMRELCVSPEFARSLGAAAERTAAAQSWDMHAARIHEQLVQTLSAKSKAASR